MSKSKSKTPLRLALSLVVVFAAIYFSVSGTKVRSAGNPSVVVNKYFNSGTTADIVELLVIQNNLDMRGMILKDFSASMVNDGGGKYQFTNNSLWSSVRSGTLIVLRNNNSAADTTVGGGDFNLDVGLQNTTYFTNAGGTFDIAAVEEVMIKTAGSGATGVTGSIHALAGGTAGAQFTATAVPKLIATGQSGTNQFVFANNSTQSINDFDGTGATGAATGLTFGVGNNANNTAYINSLRGTTNFSLNVSPNGTGTGTVTSSPAGINCGAQCSASYASGTSVTLTATAAGGSTFTSWSGCDSTSGNTCTVSMTANRSVTATFTAVAQTLNVTRNGTGTGAVTSSPAGINCGATCSATYSNGTIVTLTAAADVNSNFSSWSGCDSVSGNTCNVTMNATRNVTATFTSTQRTLSVSRAGTGSGTVTSSPAGINCGSTCTATYTDGTIVTLTATPDTSSSFAGWSGACSGTGSCTITMDGNKSATATFNFVPPPTTVKIRQVYGGGGNSGATYLNDFVELYNSGSTPVVLDGWSVQATSAAGTSWTANGPATILAGTIQPGHYYLVQESQGTGGTTPLPTADATGVITMSGTNAKVALVASSATLSGSCPLGGVVVDFVGYGTANCSEGNAPTGTLSNTTAAVRRGNGCQDTDNNANDFVTVGPIPRNSTSPTHSCGGDPAQLSALGIGSPDSVDPASTTLLTVAVTPATIPPSTGIAVSADLTSIGGLASQTFYDDGTNGDTTAGDNVFSYRAIVGAAVTTGVKNVVATVTDAQARSINESITLTVQSPSCGVERWSVKVGSDPDASLVDINHPVNTTIAALGAIPAPADPPGPPDNARVAPTETTVYTVYATMTVYKKEADVDYHIVLTDDTGHTMVAEIPSPACILAQNPSGPGRVLVSSPFTQGIMDSRAKFDSRFTATSFFQTANVPVRVTGVGFFDFIHGQTGVAPNGIELHPILSIDFTANTSTTLMSSANPSQYGQSVSITATVSNGGVSTPTGNLNFFDGGTLVGSRTLDQNGQATFESSTLSTGSHSITASYEGDTTSSPSTSAALVQVINKASSTTTVTCTSSEIYTGGAIEPCSAIVTGAGGLNQTVPVTYSGNVNVGVATASASYSGDGNHEASSGSSTFMITKAASTTTVNCPTNETYTSTAIEPCTASYSGAGGLSGTLTPTYSNNINAGPATANATYGGDANHEGSTGSSNFTIDKASSFTTLNCPASETFTGVSIEPCTASVTGAGGLNQAVTPATYANNINAGSATAAATYAGDANHDTSTGNGGFTITKATSTTTVNCPVIETYTGGPIEPCTATVTGVGGLNQSVTVSYTNNTNAGTATANATYGGDANHDGNSGNAAFTIAKATPVITWNDPADIVYGTALGAAQLNATANAAGSFSYTPASGTLLNAGAAQPLLASFTPNDPANYNATSKNVQINVLKATPAFSNLSSPTITAGTATTILSGKISFGSFVPTGNVAITLNSVTQNAAIQGDGTFSSAFATNSLAAGTYTIAYSFGGDGNFNSASGAGTLTVGYGIVALYDQTKVHQSGSTIPIKLAITDVNGNNLSSAGTIVNAVGMSLVSTTVYGPVADSGNSNPDNNFRFSGDSYIFNLQTTGLVTGIYNLYFRVGADPTLHTVQFQVK